MIGVEIRDESAADAEAIARVITRAFTGHPFSDQSEAQIVRDLRAAAALTLSRVAIEGTELVGHIAFSPVRLSDGSPRRPVDSILVMVFSNVWVPLERSPPCRNPAKPSTS